MSLDFERPPINEVVLGVFFAPIPPLRAEAVGLFWARIRETFPSVVQQPIYAQEFSPIPVMPQPGEFFPLPRFWFLSKDKTRLIQLQNGAFLYNWRKQGGDYPRFSRIFIEFLDHLENFQRYLKDDLGVGTLAFTMAELTYINLFGSLESIANPADYKRVARDFPGYDELEEDLVLENFQHVDIFRSPNGDQVIVTQRSGSQPSDERTIVVLELKVTGPVTEPITGWFSNAHNRINESFMKVTTSEMQTRTWGGK